MCPCPLGCFPLPLPLLFFTPLIEICLLGRPPHAIYNLPDTPRQTQVLDIFNQILNSIHHAAGCVEQTSDARGFPPRERLLALIQEGAPYGTQGASHSTLTEVADSHRQRVRLFDQGRGQRWRELARVVFLALQEGDHNRTAGLVNLNTDIIIWDF